MARLSGVRRAVLAALLVSAPAAANDVCEAVGACHAALAETSAGGEAVQLLQVSRTAKTVGTKENADALAVEEHHAQGEAVKANGTSEEGKTNSSQQVKQIPGLDTVSGLVPGIESVTGAIAQTTAKQMVSTLNDTLATLGQQADSLLNKSADYKATAVAKVQAAKATAQDKAAALEEQVNLTVDAFLPNWTALTSSFNRTVNVIVSALNLAGQGDMAAQVSTAMAPAFSAAASVTAGLQGAPEAVANISALAEAEIVQRLHQLNASLEDGLDHADQYAGSLDQAFGGMLDSAADALAQAVPGTDAAQLRATFDGLQATEAAISQKLLASVRVAVSGLTVGANSTEALLAGEYSGCVRTSALFALAVVAAATGLSL